MLKQFCDVIQFAFYRGDLQSLLGRPSDSAVEALVETFLQVLDVLLLSLDATCSFVFADDLACKSAVDLTDLGFCTGDFAFDVALLVLEATALAAVLA